MAVAASTQICEAIRKLVRLRFRYNGHDRVVEPYCLGLSYKGNEVLRAIQVRGSSTHARSGSHFGKLWNIAEMSEVLVLGEPFVADDPNYNPNDSAMRQIHCRIE
jgi:hypothetical protein